MPSVVFLFVVGMILLVVVITVYGRYQAQARMAEMRALAARRGYDYVEEDVGLAGALTRFALGSRGHARRATNVLRTRTDGAAVQMCDYRYTTGQGRNQRVHRQSVLLLESERLDLPAFSLCPETMSQKLAILFGRQDIDFPQRADFSEAYVLQGDDEEEIRAFFDDKILAFFARRPGLCVEGRGRRLLYYHAGQQLPSHAIHSFLGEGLALLDVLATRPASQAAIEPVPQPVAEPVAEPGAESLPPSAAEPDPLAGLDALLAEMGVDEDAMADEG
jgi:hypothetical protein